MSSRTARAPEGNPILENQKKKKQEEPNLWRMPDWLVTQHPPGANELMFIITVVIMTIIVMSHPV